MIVGEPSEARVGSQRVCGLHAAADEVRLAAGHDGAAQSTIHVQGIPHHVVDLGRVNTRKTGPGGEQEEQELGRYAWFWSFGWRQDS